MADAEPTRKIRPTYVLISSLAAVVGAFLASRLGVYGTVIGVGVISLVSTLATDLCIQSLDRTKRARAMTTTSELPSSGSDAGSAAPASALTATVTLDDRNAGDGDTADLPRIPTATLEAVDVDADPEPADTDSNGTGDEQRDWRRWTSGRIPIVAAGAVASFVLALVVITSIESVSGSSLSGDGRTTLGQLVVDDGSDTRQPGDDSPGEDAPLNQPAPDRQSPSPSDTPETRERGGAVPPAEVESDAEAPAESESPSPSRTPTPSPVPEPAEPPPADTEEDVPADIVDPRR